MANAGEITERAREGKRGWTQRSGGTVYSRVLPTCIGEGAVLE